MSIQQHGWSEVLGALAAASQGGRRNETARRGDNGFSSDCFEHRGFLKVAWI
jgi:hypothetical protein